MEGVRLKLFLASICLCVCSTFGADEPIYGYEIDSLNLIQNGDFEKDLDASSDWELYNADVVYMTDANTGSRSIKTKDRTHRFGGVRQKIYNVTGDTMYYMSAFFKIIENSETDMYYMLRMWVGYKMVNGETGQFHMARLPKLRTSDRWRQLGGDFTSPAGDLEYLTFFLEVNEQSLDYMMDTVSLIEIPEDPDWKDRAQVNIEKYRMNTVLLSTDFPNRVPYCHCEVKVDQTSRDFGFGSAIQSDRFKEESTFGEKYRQFQYDHFNWAVFGNTMKWKPMEPTKNNIKFDRVDTALGYLLEQNITVRGHSILWGIKANNPSFVQELKGEDLRSEVNRRVDYVVDHYKGKIKEWDVINEWLHGTFYDEAINDTLIQDKVYSRAQGLDPDTELFVNDYQALRLGDYTSALVDLAEELKFRDVPVHGIGIQSHLKTTVKPEKLRKRLQISTASGFPVTITELSLHTTDEQARAERLEEAMYIYFSNPRVQAIVFWFFSDQSRINYAETETLLFSGEDFTPTQAGQALLDLLKKWQTHTSFTPNARSMAHSLEGFHGGYNVEVLYKGVSVKNQTFYLQPDGDIEVQLGLKDSDFPEVDAADQNCPEVAGFDPNAQDKGIGFQKQKKYKKKFKARKRMSRKGANNRV